MASNVVGNYATPPARSPLLGADSLPSYVFVYSGSEARRAGQPVFTLPARVETGKAELGYPPTHAALSSDWSPSASISTWTGTSAQSSPSKSSNLEDAFACASEAVPFKSGAARLALEKLEDRTPEHSDQDQETANLDESPCTSPCTKAYRRRMRRRRQKLLANQSGEHAARDSCSKVRAYALSKKFVRRANVERIRSALPVVAPCSRRW